MNILGRIPRTVSEISLCL